MRWCAPGLEQPLEALLRTLVRTPWPGPPPGFRALVAARPMRTVLSGVWTHGAEQVPVVVKWHRPRRVGDHVSRGVRGGKGVREGRVLRRLAAAGVRVPRALACADEHADVLVTRWCPALAPLPAAEEASPAVLGAVAGLLAGAHAAGLRHRDLHAGNLATDAEGPLLVDLGGARIGAPLAGEARLLELGRAVHGLLGGARRTQRHRALRAYLRARGSEDVRAEARRLAPGVEAAARRVRRRYRRGRDRRARRSGRHFERLQLPDGARGVRFKDACDEALRDAAAGWLKAPPAEAEPLKSGERVLRVGDSVLKYYTGVVRGRLPRPLRALRRAYALANRDVAAARPRIALARPDGSGVYVAVWLDAPDLARCAADGSLDAAALRRLGRSLRLMHDAEVSHRDLKAPNLLAAPDGSYPIVDLDGVRIRHAPVSWARRARDVMRLDASLDLPADLRRHVLEGYWDVLPRPPVSWARWSARVAALSARKRGPSGRAR